MGWYGMRNIKRLTGNITEEKAELLYNGQPFGYLVRRTNDSDEEEYVFRIDWDAWDALDAWETVPGINMDLRLDEYVRDHVPSFIYDYVPPKREDADDLIKRYGLKEYDIWDLMLANGRIGHDCFTVRPAK